MIVLRVTCASVIVVALAACGGGHHATKNGSASTSPSTAGPSAPLTINPLTGGKPSNNPVVAVKIDDTANGRPQVGIDAADIVYIEQAEGGLTRLLAVYATRLPTVEAVRSTRVGDPELAAQYGPIAYVASGGAKGPLAALDASPLRSDISERGGAGFARDPNRPVPYNLTADLGAIAAKLKSPKAKSIGLTWSVPTANSPVRPGTVVRTTVGGTPVSFEWNAKLHRYARVIGGEVQNAADGKAITTPNVVVQFCSVTTNFGDIDQAGNPAKVTHTVGTGAVSVFRGGHRIDGTWTRPALTAGTHLKDAHGKPIALAPGGAWFVLVATGTPLN
ncbi:MAG TPA: DUF3048 domain-containing protein [Mycobacterium sp.]|nr:DUF3048 domain-containing protein [Mycobacterium sp.]